MLESVSDEPLIIDRRRPRARSWRTSARSQPRRSAIDDALGRVLAQDVRAAADVPPFPSSAMDGYAVIAGDARPNAST